MTAGIATLSGPQLVSKLAKMGRYDDDNIAHVAEGEVIVPAPIMKYFPEVREQVFGAIRASGLDPDEFIVGGDMVARNPRTGAQEFGFLSKMWKKVKKIVKKAAPLILAVALPYAGAALAGMGFTAAGAAATTAFGSGLGAMTLGQAIAVGAASGGLGTLIQGGKLKDALKNAARGAATAGVVKGAVNYAGAPSGTSFGDAVSGNYIGGSSAAQLADTKKLAAAESARMMPVEPAGPTPFSADVTPVSGAVDIDAIIPTPDISIDTSSIINQTAVEQGLTPAALPQAAPIDTNVMPTGYEAAAPSAATAADYASFTVPEITPLEPPVRGIETIGTGPYAVTLDMNAIPAAEQVAGAVQTAGTTVADNLVGQMQSNYGFQISPEAAQNYAMKGYTDAASIVRDLSKQGFAPEQIQQILTSSSGTPSLMQNIVARPASYALKGLGYGLLAQGLLGGEEEEPTSGNAFQMEETRAGIPFAGLFYNPTTGQYQDTAPDYLAQQSTRLRRGVNAAAGGHISGPGSGTSDSIPARLSDGEFVMTAKAVRGMGKGSRAEGAAKMYELMNRLERMA